MMRLLLLLVSTALAADKGAPPPLPYVLAGDRGPAPRLVTLKDGEVQFMKTAPPYQPKRLYAIFHREEKAWVFTWTDFSGKIPEPLELLYRGSILPGSYLGAKNPFQNYRITDDYRFVPTEEKEKQYLLIPARPNLIVRITYLTPPWNEPYKYIWK